METPKKDPQKELDIALAELEERVDRLRSLYEQYFMGFEKLEPSVQRKDVERRFALLRKAQIRNTAQRFRLSVVTQKYNTYSIYWTRICRQIEEGTYKRHVAKAARRFGAATPEQPAAREADFSIEIDLAELEGFDSDDLGALLAEADAAAEAYARGVVDTAPPAAPTDPPAPVAVRGFAPATPAPSRPVPARPPSASPQAPRTPGTSFAVSGRPSRGPEGHEGPDSAGRVPRQAVLPPGAKPRILVRRRNDGAGPSIPAATSAPAGAAPPPRQAPPAATAPPRGTPPAHGHGPPGSSRTPEVRPAMRSTPDHPPSSSVIRPSPAPGPHAQPNRGAPDSVRRTPAARVPIAPRSGAPGLVPVGSRPIPAGSRAPATGASPPPSERSPAPSSERPQPSRRPPPPLPSQAKKNG